MGWNGIKLHCQGKTYDLAKGKVFSSDIKDADIMVDVNDARVLVQWPRDQDLNHKKGNVFSSDDDDDDDDEPSGTHRSLQGRLVSPVSPSPPVNAAQNNTTPASSPPKAQQQQQKQQQQQQQLVVYEDEPSSSSRTRKPAAVAEEGDTQQQQDQNLVLSQSSDELSDLSKRDDDDDEFSDHDEENDPIVHSFGGGELGRTTTTTTTTSDEGKNHDNSMMIHHLSEEHIERIQNHAANQLAFSRLSSTPLSVILKNFPSSLRHDHDKDVQMDEFRYIIDHTDCIGKVAREGKDAAGKPLESEYYYIADFDKDSMRRDAVVFDLRKPGLRNCRKQHKVWIFIILEVWIDELLTRLHL